MMEHFSIDCDAGSKILCFGELNWEATRLIPPLLLLLLVDPITAMLVLLLQEKRLATFFEVTFYWACLRYNCMGKLSLSSLFIPAPNF